MMMKVAVFFKSLGHFYLDDLWWEGGRGGVEEERRRGIFLKSICYKIHMHMGLN